MSILKKNFGRRQDAIITDCFVVMPDGFVVSTVNNITTFSFRMPAQGITID